MPKPLPPSPPSQLRNGMLKLIYFARIPYNSDVILTREAPSSVDLQFCTKTWAYHRLLGLPLPVSFAPVRLPISGPLWGGRTNCPTRANNILSIKQPSLCFKGGTRQEAAVLCMSLLSLPFGPLFLNQQ